ncbi:hypothetical protein SP40_104 [Salmonella phage 40]|nr:hypothetical protein SP40_104 [Salmonella phage 40]
MANWKQTFRIDDIWKKRNGECGPEDWTDKTVHELAKEMARRIRRKWPDLMLDGEGDCDFNLVEIYDWFLSIPDQKERERILNLYLSDACMEEDYQAALRETPMVEFNTCMGLFYDWCDRNLVWVQK